MSRKISSPTFRFGLLLFIIILSIYLFIHSSIFKVTQIDVQGNSRVSRDEVAALSGLAPGINIFELNEDTSAKNIETHPMIKDAAIKRHLPHTLSINIVERQIWAIIPNGNMFLCIDDTGVCFEKLNNIPNNNYLIISMDKMPENINLGQVANSQAIDMMRQAWQAIPDNDRQKISEIHYLNEENGIKIYTIKGTEVRFGNLERLEEKAKEFTQVIKIESDMEKQGKDVLEYVDIRFKGEPVIKTKA